MLYTTDAESTDAGSDVDIIDSDVDDSWEPLDHYLPAIEIEFQSYEPILQKTPRGVCAPRKLPSGSSLEDTTMTGLSSEGTRHKTERWDMRVKRDLADIAQDYITDLVVPITNPLSHKFL